MQGFYVTRLIAINSKVKMQNFMWFLVQLASAGSTNEEAPPTDPILNQGLPQQKEMLSDDEAAASLPARS